MIQPGTGRQLYVALPLHIRLVAHQPERTKVGLRNGGDALRIPTPISSKPAQSDLVLCTPSDYCQDKEANCDHRRAQV